MAAPHMAPVPPASVRNEMLPEELEACLGAWLTLAQFNLSRPEARFAEQADNLCPFLTSYVYEISSIPTAQDIPDSLAEQKTLRHRSFLLSHRVLSLQDPPKSLLHWSFLADLSHVYGHFKGLSDLLSSLWRRKGDVIEASLSDLKRSMSLSIPESRPVAGLKLRRLAPLLHALPEAGEAMLTGSDFLDELVAGFPGLEAEVQKVVVIVTFLGLISLLRDSRANAPLFYDHMYSLKADGQVKGKASLIAGVVSSTPLLAKLDKSQALQGNQRALELKHSLLGFRSAARLRPQKPTKAQKGKGKALAEDEVGYGFDGVHVHRMSLISQIQDLFPDLGTGFIAKLLSEYNDNVEEATLHLLDDSLPPSLQDADRAQPLPAVNEASFVPEMSPRPTPILERRNIFDNDEFDRLAVDASKLHIGRKDTVATADELLYDRAAAPNKAAIMSALAAFDSDDDERDDTYDVEDVGGTVDSAVPEADQLDNAHEKIDEALFRAYKQDPKVFERDGATRRSTVRQALRNETGLTDEAIEGWLIVNGRDARKMRRLEARYSTWTGQQNELTPSAWRGSTADPSAEGSEDAPGSSKPDRGRGGRGRGGYRGRGSGRGGNVAGASDDKSTQQARHRKEANKGSRANHNRREQRARKMARGGLPG